MANAAPDFGLPAPADPTAHGDLTAPPPRRGQAWGIALILLAILGLGVAGELTHIHYKVNTDPDFTSFCNVGEAVNCETVAASSYSEVLGVPVSVWGLFAYALLLGLALAGLRAAKGRDARFPGLILLWSLCGIATSALLAVISTFFIASFCILCVVLYGLNAIIFGVAIAQACHVAGGPVRAVRADLTTLWRSRVATAVVLGGLLAVCVALVLCYPTLRMSNVPAATATAAECGAVHHTAEGHPLFGDLNAPVTIEEFSDYECAFCQRAHHTVRELVGQYGGRVRLVHRNYPLSPVCNPRVQRDMHPNACLAARAGLCADAQGHFWDFNDLLWQNAKRLERKHLLHYARSVNLDIPAFEACLLDPKTEARLQQDIRDGIGWGVTGTPAFVINGKMVMGALPPERFRAAIDDALAACAPKP